MDLTYNAMEGDTEVTCSVKSLKAFTRLIRLLKQNKSRVHEAYHLCVNITGHLSRRGIPYPRIYAEMGDISVRLGNYGAARRAINTSLSHDPNNIVALTALAKLESVKGRVTEAEGILRKALKELGYQLQLVVELAALLSRHHHDDMYSIREAESLYVFNH